MPIYYIQRKNGKVYKLDATTAISKTMTGKLTQTVVESGSTVSDHYVHNPNAFSVEGVISDIRSDKEDTQKVSAKEFIDGITAIKENRETFTFHFGNKIPASKNCMFTSITVSQDKKNGRSQATGLESFRISGSIEVVRYSNRATVEAIDSMDPRYADKLATEKESAKTTETIANLTDFQRAKAIQTAHSKAANGKALTDLERALLGG